ncbi:TonB-dependent receptor domain-containing protein [Pseudomonas sp. HK3]
MKRNLLAGLIAAISASGAFAGETVFYITEQGKPVDTLSVTVDGNRKLVGKNGVVSFDLKGGKHQVELSEFGEWAGEFEFNASSEQNAEIKVDMIGGEAIPDISVYTPGAEDAAVLGQISGYIESDETGGGVEGARVSVDGSDVSAKTNGEGYFELELPRGEYDLRIAHSSYGNRDVKAMRVFGNRATALNINMSLSGNSAIEEVVAVGSYIPSTATSQQRDSSAVLSAIGAEQMSRFGDSNAASALKRVAGVSLIGGQYAVVRGLQGRYISSTLNGLGMPSTDPMRRDVPLDLFPASVLGGIEIQKSYTPDLPGDTTGGAIRMRTKDLPDDNTSKLSASIGFNSQVTGQDVISYEGGDTDFIGIDDGTREVPSRVDSETDGGSNGGNKALLNEFDHSQYNTKQTTAIPDVSIAYSFGDRLEKGYGELAYYGALEYKSEWSNREDAYIRDTSGNFDYERSQYKVDLTGYFVTGIETNAGNEYLSKTILLRKTDDTTRKQVGINKEGKDINQTTLQWVERQFFSQQFSGLVFLGAEHTLDWRAGISHTSRYEPDRRTYGYENNLLILSMIERRFSELSEISLDTGVDHTFERAFDNGSLMKIKTGMLLSQKDREVELARYSVDGAENFTPGQDIETIFANDSYNLRLKANTTETDNYDAAESMLAIYQSYQYEPNESWVFLAGARLEDASQEITYSKKPSANSSLDTSEILPMMSAIWKPVEEWQFRFGASNTVSRPGLTELAKSKFYDPETDDAIIGNPDLELSKITNLDFRAEYYLSDSESISLALFNKAIDKPIEKTVPDASGSAGQGDTYENSDSADLLGVELDFKVDILDTDNFSGFLSGNFAWIDSEVTLDFESARLEGDKTRELQGQSEVLANVQFGVDHLATGQTVTVLINHFGDRIEKVVRGSLANEYEKGRTTLDLVYKLDLTENLTIKGKASNLTDEPVEYTQNDQVIESYKTGIDASVGIDYIF